MASKLKEMQVNPAIDDHDLQRKLQQVVGWCLKGYQVKIDFRLFGRHTQLDPSIHKSLVEQSLTTVLQEAPRSKVTGRNVSPKGTIVSIQGVP